MSYEQKQEIFSSNEWIAFEDSYSGEALAMEEYWMFAGRPRMDLYGNSDTGLIDVYKKNSSNQWEYHDDINIVNQVDYPGAQFRDDIYIGESLAVDSDVFLFGMPGYDGEGGVCVAFLNKSIASWELKLAQKDLYVVAGGEFGCSVDICNDYVIVGAQGANSSRGSATIFKIDRDTTTGLSSPIVLSRYKNGIEYSGEAGDFFGSCVKIHNGFAFVSAIGENNNAGVIYIYKEDMGGDGNWGFHSRIEFDNIQSGDKLGSSIEITDDYLFLGAPFRTSSNGDVNSGGVFIFKNVEGEWIKIEEVEPNEVGEDSTEGYNFGFSLSTDGNVLAIGAPGANQIGGAYLYSKQKDWRFFQFVENQNANSGDRFGYDTAIMGTDLIVSAPYESNDIDGENFGEVYFFYSSPVNLKYAQEFEVNQEFIPAKISSYIAYNKQNLNEYWELGANDVVIDATNFSEIEENKNKIIFDDSIGGYTGAGYMSLSPTDSFNIDDTDIDNFSIMKYPIRSILFSRFFIYLRTISHESTSFEIDILIDGTVVRTVEATALTLDEWGWLGSEFIIPDTEMHSLEFRIKSRYVGIDKIYISRDDANFIDLVNSDSSFSGMKGPDYTQSPYLTIHAKLYEGISCPENSLFIYDYKTTLKEVKTSDWYNFNIEVLDTRTGYTQSTDFEGSYFVGFNISGSNIFNFVNLGLSNIDEYSSHGSFIGDNPLNNGNYEATSLFAIDYYKLKEGTSSLNSNLWYLNIDKRYLLKIYSKVNALEDV